MKIRAAAVILALTAMLAGCGGGSSQPSGDHRACRDYRQWASVGGAHSEFGSFTNLLDEAVRSASAVPHSDAKAIANGAPTWPSGDNAAHLLWDLSNVQADAEGDLSPPSGWGQEVGSVKLDCENKL